MMDYKIRLATPEDYRKTEELNRDAFWNLHNPGCDEHYLLHTMREHEDYVSDLDFVVTIVDKIVGSIVYTKSRILSEDDESVDTMTFDPGYQRRGIGTLMIEHSTGILSRRGIPAVIIFGFPRDYVKHGFVNGCRLNIGTDYGRYHMSLLVKTLGQGIDVHKKWRYIESDVYNVNRDKSEEFDKEFPHKEKKWTPTQEEFWISSHSWVEKD